MQNSLKITTTTIAVLKSLIRADDEDPVWGYRIHTETGVETGTLHPILGRLEDRGLVVSHAEEKPPRERPPRRYYVLTEEGRVEANRMVTESYEKIIPKSIK